MIKLTLKQLAAIKELADQQSFTAAAARLYTTQSNLSSTIQEAEHMLGVRLFDRTTKSVTVTDTGKELAQGVGRVLDELAFHIDNAQAVGRLARGSLSIGVTPLLSSTVVPRLLADFHRRHPQIALRLDDESTSTLVTLLQQRSIDLAVGTFERKTPDIQLQPLFSDELVVLSHANAGLGDRVSWSAVAGLRLVGISSNSSVGALIESKFLEVKNQRPRYIVQSHHWLTVISMTEAFEAACIVPHYAFESHHVSNLRMSRLIRPTVSREVHVASLRNRELSTAAKHFLDLLKKHFS